MVTFLRNAKGKPEALAGKHDDVVMAAAIAYSVLQEQGKYSDVTTQNQGQTMMQTMFGEIPVSPLVPMQNAREEGVREL